MTVLRLPPEVLIIVAKRLPLASLLKLRKTCRKLKSVVDDAIESIKVEFNFVTDGPIYAFVYNKDDEKPAIRKSQSLDQKFVSSGIIPDSLEYWLTRKLQQIVFSVPDGTCIQQVGVLVKDTVGSVLNYLAKERPQVELELAFNKLFQILCHNPDCHETDDMTLIKKRIAFGHIMDKLLSSPLKIRIVLQFYQFSRDFVLLNTAQGKVHAKRLEKIGSMIRGLEYTLELGLSIAIMPRELFIPETLTQLEYVNICSPYTSSMFGEGFVGYSTCAKSLRKLKFSNVEIYASEKEKLNEKSFPSLEVLEIDHSECMNSYEDPPPVPLFVKTLVLRGSDIISKKMKRQSRTRVGWFRVFSFPRVRHIEYIYDPKCGDQSRLLSPLLKTLKTLKLLGTPPPPNDKYLLLKLQKYFYDWNLEEFTLSLSGIQSLFDLRDALTQFPFLKCLIISLYSPTTHSSKDWFAILTRWITNSSQQALEFIRIEAFGVEICSLDVKSRSFFFTMQNPL